MSLLFLTYGIACIGAVFLSTVGAIFAFYFLIAGVVDILDCGDFSSCATSIIRVFAALFVFSLAIAPFFAVAFEISLLAFVRFICWMCFIVFTIYAILVTLNHLSKPKRFARSWRSVHFPVILIYLVSALIFLAIAILI